MKEWNHFKEQLTAALESIQKGETEQAASLMEQIKKLPRTEEGLFDLKEMGDDFLEGARFVYPLYAAYETACNKKEGYPDILAQMRAIDKKVKHNDTFENAAKASEILIRTIYFMSPEIYEYYRELADIFRENVRRAMQELPDGAAGAAEENSEGSSEETARAEKIFRDAVAMACGQNILPAEKYQKEIGDGKSARHGENGPAILLIMNTARSAVIEIKDGGRYFTKRPYRIFVNGMEWKTTEKTIISLFGLQPDAEQVVEAYDGDAKVGEIVFRTDYEFVTLDVTRFGAKGDGVQDDTHFIQAAISACPENSRVYFPAGTYRITSLFLKSHIRMELAKGAQLLADTDRRKFPVFPGMIESYDEKDEYNLGTWEGNPLPMFSGIICGTGVEDVILYGEGVINGNASRENWWKNPKVMDTAFRPRLFFINGCKNITLQGLKFCNSPSWTLHPYFSSDLRFIDLNVENPSDSPNTDGLDPESCKNVEILGVRFSLGDDCIAVKSGKIYMGRKYKTPSENLHIRQCLMENGHGAVTLGSEMAGGVVNLTVEDCIFRYTDRGLRIKTRRGRGKDAVLSNIVFKNLTLDHVMTPLVVNAFYFCDPDGKTQYVQSREPYPVDDRTPSVKRLVFENMDCTNCHVAAGYFDGLPEQKIEEVYMKNISVSYAENAKCDVPAMSEGVRKSCRRGLFARNVAKLTLDHVKITGQDGEAYELTGVDEIEEK